MGWPRRMRRGRGPHMCGPLGRPHAADPVGSHATRPKTEDPRSDQAAATVSSRGAACRARPGPGAGMKPGSSSSMRAPPVGRRPSRARCRRAPRRSPSRSRARGRCRRRRGRARRRCGGSDRRSPRAGRPGSPARRPGRRSATCPDRPARRACSTRPVPSSVCSIAFRTRLRSACASRSGSARSVPSGTGPELEAPFGLEHGEPVPQLRDEALERTICSTRRNSVCSLRASSSRSSTRRQMRAISAETSCSTRAPPPARAAPEPPAPRAGRGSRSAACAARARHRRRTRAGRRTRR